MYYELAIDIDQNFGIAEIPRLPKYVSFKKGEIISINLDLPLVFEVNNSSTNPPSDLPGLRIPVLSANFLRCLNEAGVSNLQIFSALLVNPESQERWDAYQAVNIIGKVACVDMEKSAYTEIGPDLFAFDEIVVNEARASGLLVFRLAEAPQTILFHESIVDYLDEHCEPALLGVDFRECGTSEPHD